MPLAYYLLTFQGYLSFKHGPPIDPSIGKRVKR